MPANMRFCAVQIEVICLLLIQLISTLRSAQFLQTVKKNEHMFESRNIHNMLHEHVSHVQSHNVMRRNILCPWTFSKFKWWVRWVKKPFSQKFCMRRQNLLQRGHIAFNSPLCLEKSPAPVWSQFWYSFCGLIAGINLAFFLLLIWILSQ